MHAHVLLEYGKINQVIELREQPEAPIAANQVRVKVRAVALNPVDLKTREGEPKMLLPFSPPFVLGVDLTGTVAEVRHEVRSLKIGDSVFAHTGMDRMGAFAETVVLDENRVARAPEGMKPEEVACLPLPGLCSLQALDAGSVTNGSRVLIHGGVGGVGSIAVQLAKHRGAEVFATVSGADMERARALGVTHPIDFRTQHFEDVARGMDFVFDTVGGDTLKRSWSVVKPGGTLASLHVPPPAQAIVAAGLRANFILRLALPLITRAPHAAARKAGARFAPILTVPSKQGLETLTRIAEESGLRVAIDKSFPFADLGAAIDHVASGKAKGRVVLTLP